MPSLAKLDRTRVVSCVLQLAAGLGAQQRRLEVLHMVEVLDRAYALAERARP